MNQYDHIRYQLRLMELESENDQEAVARNLGTTPPLTFVLTEQEAQQRAELRGLQRQNISWWMARNGGDDE